VRASVTSSVKGWAAVAVVTAVTTGIVVQDHEVIDGVCRWISCLGGLWAAVIAAQEGLGFREYEGPKWPVTAVTTQE